MWNKNSRSSYKQLSLIIIIIIIIIVINLTHTFQVSFRIFKQQHNNKSNGLSKPMNNKSIHKLLFYARLPLLTLTCFGWAFLSGEAIVQETLRNLFSLTGIKREFGLVDLRMNDALQSFIRAWIMMSWEKENRQKLNFIRYKGWWWSDTPLWLKNHW